MGSDWDLRKDGKKKKYKWHHSGHWRSWSGGYFYSVAVENHWTILVRGLMCCDIFLNINLSILMKNISLCTEVEYIRSANVELLVRQWETGIRRW